MKKLLFIKNILVIASVVIFANSLFAQDPPSWVSGNVPISPDGLYAKGMANIGINKVLAQKKAENDARAELGKIITIKTRSEMQTFLEEHTDLVDNDNSKSTEFSKIISETVSEATLAGVQILEVWQDEDNKIFYALAYVDKENLVKQIKTKVSQEGGGTFTEDKMKLALDELDKTLKEWDVNKDTKNDNN